MVPKFQVSLFLILYRAFSHFMYLSNSSFAKEEGVHHKMYKTKLVHCCDVVPNLVVYVKNFNFCLFVCLYLTFCQFRKRIWSNHISKNCSEIKTVTWSVIWLWKLQFTILIFFTPLQVPPPAMIIFFFIFVQGCILRHASTCP